MQLQRWPYYCDFGQFLWPNIYLKKSQLSGLGAPPVLKRMTFDQRWRLIKVTYFFINIYDTWYWWYIVHLKFVSFVGCLIVKITQLKDLTIWKIPKELRLNSNFFQPTRREGNILFRNRIWGGFQHNLPGKYLPVSGEPGSQPSVPQPHRLQEDLLLWRDHEWR